MFIQCQDSRGVKVVLNSNYIQRVDMPRIGANGNAVLGYITLFRGPKEYGTAGNMDSNEHITLKDDECSRIINLLLTMEG